MKLKLALAAVLAAAWTGPFAARAEDGHKHDGGKHAAGKEGPKGEARKDGGREGQDPEVAKKLDVLRAIEDRLRGAAIKSRAGTDAEKAAAKTEARKILGELFDAKLDLEATMLAHVEKRASELKERIARKKAAREEMIEARLSRMTGEIDDW